MKPRLVIEKLAKSATRRIGIHWSESFPLYFVTEHPKSGGTWLSRMISDYLEVPFPRYSLVPHAFSSVTHSHWGHDRRLRRVFYLYRDGRDVMTSFYFDRVRIARYQARPGSGRVRRTYEKLFGKDYNPADVVRHLPRFIEHEFAHPGRGTPLNWRDHVEDWHQPGREGRIAYLSYEELLDDCAGTLKRAIEEIADLEVDPWQLETTVEKMSMKRLTGRSPGQGDLTQHIRKGIAGDWQQKFSREAAETFDHLAGDALVELGYESDRGWVDRYQYPTP